MQRTPVTSSQIVSVGHDPETSTLEIEFKNNSTDGRPNTVYQYEEVSPEAHKALIEAESIGRHFGTQVRGKFKFKKLELEKKEQ